LNSNGFNKNLNKIDETPQEVFLDKSTKKFIKQDFFTQVPSDSNDYSKDETVSFKGFAIEIDN
tara:strand:- start:862 stop:1050 length:189 start_codon:yes stop_codon:yes gene_type:complete